MGHMLFGQNSNNVWISDNCYDTYINPVLWGDWPDPDFL